MATATPTRLQSPQAPVSTPSPGSWRHPRFDEIARRQRGSTFNDDNIRRIAWNGGALVALTYVFLDPTIHGLLTHQSLRMLTTPISCLVFVIFFCNISIAALPLIKAQDDLTDIPLTPTQRALLGLDPNATPPLTPGIQYITPPRYPRSPTPRNISPAGRSISNDSTPTSRKASPSFGGDSPSASPLWQKSMGSTRDQTRRYSFGSPSPLGPGLGGKDSVLGVPNTPSPTAGRGPTVGLNSKWLYDKGRRSSGSRSIYS